MGGKRFFSSSVLSCNDRKLMNCTKVSWHCNRKTGNDDTGVRTFR